jgi:hypothetical protein
VRTFVSKRALVRPVAEQPMSPSGGHPSCGHTTTLGLLASSCRPLHLVVLRGAQ